MNTLVKDVDLRGLDSAITIAMDYSDTIKEVLGRRLYYSEAAVFAWVVESLESPAVAAELASLPEREQRRWFRLIEMFMAAVGHYDDSSGHFTMKPQKPKVSITDTLREAKKIAARLVRNGKKPPLAARRAFAGLARHFA